MKELNEKLFTPQELADNRILSLPQQWKERKSGRLKCYRLGRKILYSERHLTAYLELCETSQNEVADHLSMKDEVSNQEEDENV